MSFSRASLIAAAVATAGLFAGTQAQAADYIEVFSQADSDQGLIPSAFLDQVVTDGNQTAYAINRDTTGNDSGLITKLVDGAFDSVVMSNSDWAGTGSSFDIAAFGGAELVGSDIGFISFFDNAYYKAPLAGGTPSVFVDALTFGVAAGGVVNLSSMNQVLADGSAYVYDGATDQVLYVDALGNVSVEMTSTDISTLTGTSLLLGTGFGVLGTDLYFGSNSSDSLYKWDTVNNVGSVVLNTAQLEALSDDIDGSAGIDDIFFAPDGLGYFYEDDADYLYSFDPADPVTTLSVVLTEAQLTAGPAGSDQVQTLQWYKGRLAWTDQRDGFYVLIPSPAGAGAGIAMIGGLALRRRRA